MKIYFFLIFLILQAPNVLAKDIGYDPLKDPFEQLDNAIEIAKKDNQLILVIAGGDWCRWCYVLDDYFKSNTKVYNRLKETFVPLKVYYGDENRNEEFFSQLPKAKGYPHFWVISPEKLVIHSQETGVFEEGNDGYSDSVFNKFIEYFEQYISNNQKPSES
ncbi:thioredoxin family protein [Pleionea sediminis]|uniref:thioredoxin family protein n=1 Tax=Pleionea sediminis TaxID=2569479 RepID=UPI0011847541|nr:thioredoxin family protein [Pleionea sediminis]